MRPSPVFLAIIALTAVGGWLAWISVAEFRAPLAYAGVFIFVIAGWIVSLSLHEFGHAFTAWRFGDHDIAVRGYLTLNPFKYTNPLLSLGLAGADHPVRRHRPTRRRGMGAYLVHDRAAEVDRQPRRTGDERAARGAVAGGDAAVLRPGAPGVLGRGGFPGIPADHRRGAQPAAHSGAGRLRRPGAAPEPGDAARARARQAVGLFRLPAAVDRDAAEPVLLCDGRAGSSICRG